MDKNFVAVGLLTRNDLEVLGEGYKRAVPLQGLEGFEDLLAMLDDVEAISAKPPETGRSQRE